MESWIKICGMTTEAAVQAALAAGVDAIGFVFAPSVRQVTPQRAAELAATARGFTTCVAVTTHPSQAEVDAILSGFGPDVLQTDWSDLQSLRLPASLPLLPVLRNGAGATGFCGGAKSRVLFEGPRSGTGQTSDWNEAAQLARQTRLILAGGLNRVNVADAIRAVHPFGVDTSSGVESAPGIKSAQLIAGFVTAARAAFNELAT